MSPRLLVGFLCMASSLAVTSLAQAQCTKDTECKGDRVCEGGSCVTPAQPLQPASPAPITPAATAPPPAPAAPAYVVPPASASQPLAPKLQRHSTGMMATGIVLVSVAPLAWILALVADIEQGVCEGNYLNLAPNEPTPGKNCGRYDPTIYGGLFVGGVMLGVGIPMIVIGAKKEPVGTARVAPWLSPQAGGVSLRLDM